MRSFITYTFFPYMIRFMKPRRMKWAGHVAYMREKRNAHTIFVGKPDGKKL
jgi:hypothetical protein